MNEAEEASQFYDFSTDLEFNDLLKTLPEDSRLIFQMYYGEQFSIGEIAQLLHMNENTVKTRLSRGRGVYKKLYLKEHPEFQFE